MDKKFTIEAGGWKILGGFGVIFGAICLIGLVAVVSLDDADELASIALVLAIAAFVVQIIVSALQNAASRAAESGSQRLNSETNMALEQIKANAVANQEILARQFDTLLDALIQRDGRRPKDSGDGTTPEKAGTGGGASSARADSLWTRNLLRSSGPSAEDERVIDRIRSFPSEEEARGLLVKLKSLSASAVAMLERYAKDELSSRQAGQEVGLVRSDTPLARDTFDELRAAGLLEVDADDEALSRLTEEGREIVRLIKGSDTPPPIVAREFGLS